MTFTEWYKVAYNDEWNEHHAVLFSLIDDYEKYCEINSYEPVWDG